MTLKRRVGNLLLVAAVFQSGAAFAAMKIPAKFEVSPLGSATYAIPLHVVPGTAAMVPDLTLTYDSAAGNGLLGKGWMLTGLSTISRCAPTTAQDGGLPGAITMSATDRFCMDGARLVVSNGGTYGADGTEYRTEEESFSKIVSYGSAGDGPAWFKVWTKSGQIMEFGNTADSRVEARGKAVARLWALSKVQDVKSNYLTVSYTEDAVNGNYYPLRIDYTGNTNQGMAPNSSVRFVYAARSDVETAYRAGSLTREAVRMTNVQMYASATLVRDYQINYAVEAHALPSRVTSIRQCAGGGLCLPATTFDWAFGGGAKLAGGSWLATGGDAAIDLSEYMEPILSLDMNGDGKTDLVQPIIRNGNLWLIPMLSNGTTFVIGAAWDTGYINNGYTLHPGDINGDGRQDIALSSPHAANQHNLYVPLISTGSSFIKGQEMFTVDYAADSSGQDANLYLALLALDVNGDSRTDLVQVYNKVGVVTAQVLLSNGSTWVAEPLTTLSSRTNGTMVSPNIKVMPADLNGDGKMDLVQTWSSWTSNDPQSSNLYFLPLISNGAGFTQGAWTDTGMLPGSQNNLNIPQTTVAMDVNGDGADDILMVDIVDRLRLLPWYSNGVTFTKGVPSNLTQGFYGVPSIMDINGDGKMDMMQTMPPVGAHGSPESYLLRLQPILSDGTTFVAGEAFDTSERYDTVYLPDYDPEGNSILNPTILGQVVYIDFNGDGKSDLVQLKHSGGGPLSIFPHLSDQRMGGLIDTITDGLGAVVQIGYRPQTDAGVYAKDSSAVFPVIDMQSPSYLVANVQKSNGIGGRRIANYTYGGLKLDSTGRGMLGMRWIQSQDVETGIVSRTEFRQDWPYIGKSSTTTQRLTGAGNAGLLRQVVTNYSCTDFVSASGCTIMPQRRYFSAVSQTVSTAWDINGASLPSTTVGTAYDAWGNPVTVTTTTGGYVSTVVNTYANDSLNWFLGQLKNKTETNTMP